jgi:Dolichyl-phosphate-mannose-protein mannosyltransferase
MHRISKSMQKTGTPRADARNALLCAAAVAAAFLIVNPFVQMPFDDDWSYAFTVREFLRTGRMLYNGWSAPLILTQVWWGALFSEIFGYSFIVLRFSTLPMAVGCAILAYLLARRADLAPSRAIFCSLLLCLSPLFLPLALSFMTDVPALMFTLLCLYAFVRAAQSLRTMEFLAWLGVGIIFGIIGGMGRQTVWVVPLSVVPYLMLTHRKSPALVAAALLGWLLVVLDIVLSLRWFDRQPWVYLDPPMLTVFRVGLRKPGIFLGNVIEVCFTIVMMVLPIAFPMALSSVARLWRMRKTWRGLVTAAVICLLAAAIARNPALGMAPWLFNILSIHGVIGSLELSGHRPISLPMPVRGILSAMILMCCYFLLARGVEAVLEPRLSLASLREFFTRKPPIFSILAIFGSVYFFLMIVRSAQDVVFDRYLLPLIPCVAIGLLCACRPRAVAWTLLAIYIVYGLATTQDNLALAAARRAAVNRLEAAGVPSTQIAAGFEYDFYTQLQQEGHINRYGILNPPHAFDPSRGYVPALKCRYRIEWAPHVDTKHTQFGVIDYISWLPPFHRRIFIDEFRHPWWLNPHRNSKTPPPPSYEDFYD